MTQKTVVIDCKTAHLDRYLRTSLRMMQDALVRADCKVATIEWKATHGKRTTRIVAVGQA